MLLLEAPMSEPTAAEWAVIEDKALDAAIEAYLENEQLLREFGPDPEPPDEEPPYDWTPPAELPLAEWFGTLTPTQQDEVLDRYAQHIEGEWVEKVLRRHGLIEAPPEPRPDFPHPTLQTRL
jgi:hypothetical protein